MSILFKKILVANRGEIAVRVMRACREMGIRSVAVFSEVDRKALHVRYADEALAIGPAPAIESYLRVDRIIDAARRSGAEAIHPGYGFLAESADFARACSDAGIVFIGPSPEAMELMGSKTAARRLVMKAGLPVIPGTEANLESIEDVARVAREIGYPVMLKASAGGGGKGLRMVPTEADLESAWRNARSEAQNAFDDPSVYLEKRLERPRHVEIQLLGDAHGNLIYLGERECSLQRRHQKILEECPSPMLDPELRRRMGETAVRIGKLACYTNAGTAEFLVDQERNFFFLEMNARLQVEHPVTELVVGIDLVKEQIHIAAGDRLAWQQQDVRLRGAAIEARIYAEDPARDFFPSPGLITRLSIPSGPGVRNDSGVYEGWRVPLEYDPLLAKLVVWGTDRSQAVASMQRALSEYEVAGLQTNLQFFRQLLAHPEFVGGQLDTSFIDRMLAGRTLKIAPPTELGRVAILAVALEMSRWAQQHRGDARPNGRASRWKAEGRVEELNHWPRS
ncbi:MAG TPA: acetyl-CoA carboxylase biotin carboxylase subunit [Terriglobia bacterium]|nr:acetyl-CoA carboxylase biotin carboxylase subunit [Terriglobia bacterium]